MNILLFTPYTINEPIGIFIFLSFISLIIFYFWYASVDILKGINLYEKYKWITYIPVFNFIFSIFQGYVFCIKQLDLLIKEYIKKYEETFKNP